MAYHLNRPVINLLTVEGYYPSYSVLLFSVAVRLTCNHLTLVFIACQPYFVSLYIATNYLTYILQACKAANSYTR